MANTFAREALRICAAQICQNIGWQAVHESPMNVLIDILEKFVLAVAKSSQHYCIQYNRTEPNLDDLSLSFKDFGIGLQEIEEYVNNVEPVPFAHKIAPFPVRHPPNLQHPKPESRELLVRPEHILDYFPLMRPDLEEDDVLFNHQTSVDGVKKPAADAGGDSPSPFSSPKHGSRRSADWAPDTPNKKPRYYSEEEGRPMREVTSVFMTAAGFISPVHEGKTADPSLPCLIDSPPPTPEFPSPSHTVTPVKKDSKNKDVKKDKSSKPKKDKDGKKDIKKLKSSKKEKENKENAISKHDKAMTASSSSSIKKEHSSHKSSKSEKSSKLEDARHQKVKSDKAKIKARKEELHKMKEGLKLIKLKAKMKHTGSSSSSLKPSKLSSSKKFKSARISKPYKNFKSDKVKTQTSPIKSPPPVPVVPKEPPVEIKAPIVEPIIEKQPKEEPTEREDLSFREESPESRLVIDDSLETQARQERESRLEVIDECIEAVIRQGEKESEVEAEKTHKAMDETINAVVRGPPVKKLEPKDIYDFTDTSDDSSISSCDIPLPPQSPILPPKKEKKTLDNKKSSESPKKNKSKDKQKKKGGKEPKAKSPSPFSPPKTQKTQFVLKVDDRTPSPPPTLKDDLLSSDASTPSSSPPHNAFLELSPQRQGHMHPPSLLSHMPSPLSSSFIPMPVSGSGYSTNPFTPMRSLPCHMQTHFPTPPLFVTPAKTESSASFQNMQPLNLAKSGPSSVKSSPDKSFELSSKAESSDLIKKAVNLIDKSKSKDKKEKIKKKGKKETDKAKEKKEKEESKEKEKAKPKEKPKAKTEKNIKVDKRKSKPEKKKVKEKDDKAKEDSSVPKITMKLSSGTGSTKILVKPNTKNSTPLSSSPSSSHDEDEMLPSPSPPLHVPSPEPQREPTPPPPPSPSPPPAPVKEPKEMTPPPAPPPPITKTTSSRGRGRGKKAAVQVVPPARTVITETVGTIVDESGNKIWICPACSGADDGSPMIGCDECDDWYHWVCVGIVVPPKEEENWFCVRCIAKRQTPAVKRRRKKHKKDK